MKKPLVIVGASAIAEVALEYFSLAEEYEVSAFAVERQFLKKTSLLGKPVVSLEDLKQLYPPEQHFVFVAVSYQQLNRLRERLFSKVKEMGYKLASYISPQAVVSPSAQIGEHCFIFENNVIQPYARIGNNVIIWSGNHIGHHSVVEDHCFISSHSVVSGFATVGHHSFLGVNSTIANDVKIAPDTWVGPSVTITQDTKAGDIFSLDSVSPSSVSAYRFFKLTTI